MSTEFYEAIRRNDVARVKEMLAADPTLANVRFDSDSQPLHETAERNNCDLTRLLLDYGADVNGLCYDDMTPLHCAAQAYAIDVARILIAAGADVTRRDKRHRTPATAALQELTVEARQLAQILFGAGTPYGIFDAAALSDVPKVREILESQGTAAFENVDQNDILMFAVIGAPGTPAQIQEVVKLLFEHGLSPDSKYVKRAADWAAGQTYRVGDVATFLRSRIS
jgi:ankyrin repeat protein